MPILLSVHKRFTAVAAAAIIVTGAAVLGAGPAGATVRGGPAAAPGTAGGLRVAVSYAERKATTAPPHGTFPSPWQGSPDVTFLGNTIPKGSDKACGTIKHCFDAGAIKLHNPTSAPITVSSVVVNVHGSIKGGVVYNNIWGSFTVQPGDTVILTENPPHSNPSTDNFDTSGDPVNCGTPLTVAPFVQLTIGGVTTTLTDSGHVLDTGGVDPGSCNPTHNESIQWRKIGT